MDTAQAYFDKHETSLTVALQVEARRQRGEVITPLEVEQAARAVLANVPEGGGGEVGMGYLIGLLVLVDQLRAELDWLEKRKATAHFNGEEWVLEYILSMWRGPTLRACIAAAMAEEPTA